MSDNKYKIVISGGPGGGKTTALDLIQREFQTKVKVVPEAATMLFAHGLCRECESHRIILLQEAIFQMQNRLEESFHSLHPESLLVCDRGTLDGLAYWPHGEESFFNRLNTNFKKELNRYHAVIFFQTAAGSGEEIKSHNPYRLEDSKTALEIDERLKAIWQRHDNFHYIHSDTSFMRKIAHGLITINGVLNSLQV